MSDIDLAEDEPDDDDDDDDAEDRPGATLTITAPRTTSTGRDTQIVNLDAVDWPALVRSAANATDPADFNRAPLPGKLDRNVARLLWLWCRTPIHEPTRSDPAVAALLDGSTPWYPAHRPDRGYPDTKPVEAIHYIWTVLQHVEDHDAEHEDWIDAFYRTAEPGAVSLHGLDRDDDIADEAPFMWWPMTALIGPDEHHPHKTWIHLHDACGRQLAVCWFRNHTPAPAPEPVDTRGHPLKTTRRDRLRIDIDPTLAARVEQERLKKMPAGRNPGHPPETRTVLGQLTARNRMSVAVNLVLHDGWRQADAARACNVRTDSISRAVTRARKRG